MYRARSRRLAQYKISGLEYNMNTAGAYYLQGFNPEICCRIDNTHFATISEGNNDLIRISIFSINPDGTNITRLKYIDSNYEGNIIFLEYMGNSTFVLAFRNYSNDKGYLQTFTFDSSYNLTRKNTLNFYNGESYPVGLKKIDDTHFILVYYRSSNETNNIRVYSIDSSYGLTQESTKAVSDILRFSNILMLDTTHFIISYLDYENEKWKFVTYSINSSYVVNTINSLYFSDEESGNTSGDMTLLEPGIIGVFREEELGWGIMNILSYNTSTYSIIKKDENLSEGTLNIVVCETIDSRHFITFYDINGDNCIATLVTINDNYQIINKKTTTFMSTTRGSPYGCKLTNTLFLITSSDENNTQITSILIT